MLSRNIFSVLLVTTFLLVYSTVAQRSPRDSFIKIAEQSRHLAEAGKWDEAKAVLEEELAKKKRRRSSAAQSRIGASCDGSKYLLSQR
jgi:hypothetical protein